MLRPNVLPGFLIFQKDIGSGMVKKDTFKTMLEFHIYRHRELKKSLIELPNSSKEALEKEQPLYLHAIIVTKDDSHHIEEGITPELEPVIYVKGLKFDNEMFDGKESRDLDKYLRKTGRK